MGHNSTLAALKSPTTAMLYDEEMLDQLYSCVANSYGYHAYSRSELMQELSYAAHPGHNYAAYMMSSVRISRSQPATAPARSVPRTPVHLCSHCAVTGCPLRVPHCYLSRHLLQPMGLIRCRRVPRRCRYARALASA